jgi:glycosyltransferase involved in cell wall biosynthesis
MNPYLSVIIPAYNEAIYIGRCLQSLKNQNCHQQIYEVIVVDNESTDSTPEIAQNYNVKLLARQPGNVGRMRNLGAQHARGTILAFIDADCVVDPDWISRAIQLSTDYPTKVFGGGCLLPDNPTIVEKYWLLGDPETRLPKDLIGASIVLQKEAFETIGGFDENVTSGEDTALSKAAAKSGLTVRITSDLSVVHLGNAKTFVEFARRQVWHGENYLRDIKLSFVDPTFYLLLINLFFIMVTIGMIIASEVDLIQTPCLAVLFLPVILSIKRIKRSKKILNLRSLGLIYLLDFIYIQARSYSVAKSITELVFLNRPQ